MTTALIATLPMMLALQLPTPQAKPSTPENIEVAAKMAYAAKLFLESLSPDLRAKATMSFDDPARTDWHWIPKPERKGVKFREMTEAQTTAAEALIQTGLSDVGYQKSKSIRRLESVLKILEKDTRGVRDPVKYYITVFGVPGSTGVWGWSCEGHHLSLNYCIRDGAIVQADPTFMGANPRLMTANLDIGPTPGTRTLEAEESLAFELAASFDDKQRAIAVTDQMPPKTLQSGPPEKLYQGRPQGIAASQLTQQQRAQLVKLIATYAANLAEPIGKERMEAIEKAGLQEVHFRWMGAVSLDKPHYFRVQGPTFIVELDNIQSDPQGRPANHIHSVWRTPRTSEK